MKYLKILFFLFLIGALKNQVIGKNDYDKNLNNLNSYNIYSIIYSDDIPKYYLEQDEKIKIESLEGKSFEGKKSMMISFDKGNECDIKFLLENNLDVSAIWNQSYITLMISKFNKEDNLKIGLEDSGKYDNKRVTVEVKANSYLKKINEQWDKIVIPIKDFPENGKYINMGITNEALFDKTDCSIINVSLRLANNKKEKKSREIKIDDIKIVYESQEKVIREDKMQDGIYLGVTTQGAPNDIQEVYSFESLIGKKVAQIMWYVDWSTSFPKVECLKVNQHNAIPHITWEPWIFNDKSKIIKLYDIILGKWDEYITSWAHEIKNYGKPLFLRWAHEFNGNWYPWSIASNEKQPEQYILAYMHLHDIFENIGATNVLWIWSPGNMSEPDEDWNDYIKAYPGDEYVDWIGLDGYNFGNSIEHKTKWTSFNTLFGQIYRRLKKNGIKKSIMISEFGCAEEEGLSKADWFKDMDEVLSKKYLEIKAIVFFNINKEKDWRLNSSLDSIKAIKQIVLRDYYLTSGKNLAKVGKKVK